MIYLQNDKDSLKMQLAQTSCKDNTVKVITNENKLPEQIFACPKCSKVSNFLNLLLCDLMMPHRGAR